MISELFLAAFMSISYRTANIEPNPNDYEYALGLESKVGGYVEMSRERENGIIYDTVEYQNGDKRFVAKVLYKESRDIDSQTFGYLYPLDRVSVGIGLSSKKWNNGEPIGIIRYGNKIINIGLEINNDRTALDVKLSKKYPVVENVYLEPVIKYYAEDYEHRYKKYWQAKLRVGYKFN